MNTDIGENSEGIVYIATGSEFVEESILSVQTLRNSMPDVDVTLMTDEKVETEYFDNVIQIPDPEYGFEDQILNLEQSPYQRTIYLDTDIYVDGDFTDLFDLVDSFDLGLAYTSTRESKKVGGVPECFPEYNSGVMVYENTEKFSDFISLWKSIYFSEKENDETMRNQPSLRKALYDTDLRLATLPPEYNCRFNFPGEAAGRVKIFHGRLISVDGPGAGNYFDIEKVIKEINKTEKPRVFTQLGGITVHTNKEDSLLHRARLSYRMHGPKHVIIEATKLIKKLISS